MKYTTLAHHRDFAQAIRGMTADDHYLIAAIYLLTADRDLWRRSRHEFFDHQRFDEHLIKQYDGKFVSGGYVCMDDGAYLEELLP